MEKQSCGIKNKKRIISLVALFLVSLFTATTVFGQETVSVTSSAKWHRESVDNEHMNRRIAAAAEQYKEYAPILRIAFYDIGYPKDKVEFQEMNGYAVLLVTALSQDAEELPVKKAYVQVEGKNIELKQFKEIKIQHKEISSQTVKTFGQYRTDTLYLFPVHLRHKAAQLLVDFAKNRVGMKLAEFDGSIPKNITLLPDTKPVENRSIEEALKRFMKREYPGYFEN